MRDTAQYIEMLKELLSLIQDVEDKQCANSLVGIDCVNSIANAMYHAAPSDGLSTGKKIRKIRQHRDMSTDEMGKYLRMTGSAIRHYENDARTPSDVVLILIADQLGVSPSALMERNLHSLNDCVHALFDIEDFGAFNSQEFRDAIALWHIKRAQLASGEITEDEYLEWKWKLTLPEPT